MEPSHFHSNHEGRQAGRQVNNNTVVTVTAATMTTTTMQQQLLALLMIPLHLKFVSSTFHFPLPLLPQVTTTMRRTAINDDEATIIIDPKDAKGVIFDIDGTLKKVIEYQKFIIGFLQFQLLHWTTSDLQPPTETSTFLPHLYLFFTLYFT